jgi:L-alanine-DL-glutamate epimerase-like enolase superfamily enzyme
MRITEIRIRREPMALTRPYSIAYKTVSEVENCVVELAAEGGLTGYGASNPSEYVVGESLDDTLRTLTPEACAPLIGRDVRLLRPLTELIESMFPTSPGSRAALDIALHDLHAKAFGVPLGEVLGCYHDALPTSITIGIKGVAETLEEAAEYLGRGFRHLKVKLGSTPEEDLERLHKLREHFGYYFDIRVDANQAYDAAQAVQFHQRSMPLHIELTEQPLPATAVAEMRQLPDAVRSSIAADESLVTPLDALLLAQAPAACGIFNIKLMKCGGITPALRIADIARLSGIRLMWGCNDESIISISAALHAAFACPHTRYLDLDGSLDLARDVVRGGFLIEQGIMRPAGGPGLGVEPL